MTSPKAMKALYGARAHDARANIVKAHCSPGERPQEIFTPEPVLRVLRAAWGSIKLDPCGHPDAIVLADETWTGHKVPTGTFRKDGTPITRWDGPGLVQPWRDGTYYNCPFVDLRLWLAKAMRETPRHCGLFPARTNRTWCRDFLTRVDGICWLNPLAFEGYDQAHPDRLVLAYCGPDVRVVAAHTPPELGMWTLPLQRLY